MNLPQHNITYKTDSYPTGLKTHHEIAEVISGGLSAERVLELADSGYIPHYRIDGGIPLFKVTEVKAWISQNAIYKSEGRSICDALRIVVPAPEVVDTPPYALCNIPHLQQLPKWGYQSGVYFLCLKGEVVYVGQSVTPSSRVSSHNQDKQKDFDTVYLLPVPQSELDDVESAFIYHLMPVQQGGLKRGKDKPYAPKMSKPKEEILSKIMHQETRR